MNADALELVFPGSAVLGTALLPLWSVGAGMHVRLRLPFRIPPVGLHFLRVTRTDDTTGMPALLGFLAMFGIGGLFGAVVFGLGPAGRTAVALAFGAFGAAVALALFALLRRAGGDEPTAPRGLGGRKAPVVLRLRRRRPRTLRLAD